MFCFCSSQGAVDRGRRSGARVRCPTMASRWSAGRRRALRHWASAPEAATPGNRDLPWRAADPGFGFANRRRSAGGASRRSIASFERDGKKGTRAGPGARDQSQGSRSHEQMRTERAVLSLPARGGQLQLMNVRRARPLAPSPFQGEGVHHPCCSICDCPAREVSVAAISAFTRVFDALWRSGGEMPACHSDISPPVAFGDSLPIARRRRASPPLWRGGMAQCGISAQ